MEKWNYAELSKAAKEAGGPEKYIEFLEEVNRQKGRNEMLPWMGVTALGASLLTAGIIKIVNITKYHKQIKENEIGVIKSKLVENINEYDLKHLEEERENNERISDKFPNIE